jgi:hypothetical protein
MGEKIKPLGLNKIKIESLQENKEKCAPDKKFNDDSCFTLESLQLIAKKYNEINNNKINITNNKKELVEQLTLAFSNKCNNQTCWLSLDLIKDLENEEISKYTFRPKGPKTNYEWLSTTNIDDVIEQYQKLYDDFVFLGALPNDFEELPLLGLSNINFDDFVRSKKYKLGMVINLDTHKQSGSHWVALYTDLSNNKLYYFDSVGNKPGRRIKRFNNKIFKYLLNKNFDTDLTINEIKKARKNPNNKYNNILKNIDIRYNKYQHQKKNTECGVYSINFILRCVKGENFDDIIKNITPDDEINKCRQVYFRNK